MKDQLALSAVILVCAVQGYFRSQPAPAISQAHHLSINDVRLGMTRTEVDRLFLGDEKRTERSAREHFGMLPGSAGFGNGTDVRFDSSAHDARVIAVSGTYLSYDGVELCREMWRIQTPDPRPVAVKKTLGIPDRVSRDRNWVRWSYDRYQLTIDTSPQYPWGFTIGICDKQ